MRIKTRTWALISAVCFIGGIAFWKFGEKKMEHRRAVPAVEAGVSGQSSVPSKPSANVSPVVSPASLITTAVDFPVNHSETNLESVFRLRNTSQSAGQLARNEKAVMLRNAFIDTTAEEGIAIPQRLRATADSGSYIVQAKGKVDAGLRKRLAAANAEIVSYVPNNAFLVRVSGAGAQQLAGLAEVQSVIPYEPYFKLDMPVMPFAVEDKPIQVGAKVRLTLFPGELATTEAAVQALGVRVMGQDSSPFGPELIVQPQTGQLVALAQLPGVQNIEFVYARETANDLSRARMGVSADTVVLTNYLELTGTNIFVNVNDTGVDVSHPDLTNRVFAGQATVMTDVVDPDGHGTHVAGIIASSGENGPNPGTNAIGSAIDANFRGMAHGATILSFNFLGLDTELQRLPALTNFVHFGKTNALISNNSWSYGGAYGYNTAAASYDAAVRDSVPDMTGSQPVLFVFAAGNSGGGNDSGLGGVPDFVSSPGTAKNVITVGAVENLRNITNEVVRTNESGNVSTNAEFLGLTDSSNQVASFSGRGNVGIGLEGDFGRFKPDVVAPGTFIVSTRSTEWNTNAYYNPTNVDYYVAEDLVMRARETNFFSLLLPENIVGYTIEVVPNDTTPVPTPAILIYTNAASDPSTDPANLAGTNYVEVGPGDPGLIREDYVFIDVVNTNNFPVGFDLIATVLTTNNFGNYMEVLSGLNERLIKDSPPPKYRYESGTSMAAPVISGMLALLQEYFQTQAGPEVATPSPALMKALVINSSRTVSGLYTLRTKNNINHQGWGLPALERMLPKTNSILFFDQHPTNSLATDEQHVRVINVNSDALASSLRVSLVWTDPPGNPAVGIKLVNDLDLIVTNLTTGDVYFGNNFQGSSFSSLNIIGDPTNSIVVNSEHDVVNNVENVYINGPLDSEFAVAVRGHRVNVNAVTTQTNGIKQDYALVVSIGDLTLTNALSVTNAEVPFVSTTNVTTLTNLQSTVPGEGYSLSFLDEQRVGANNPYEILTNGTRNQWTFYRFTNSFGHSNVAFAVFGATELSGVATRDWQLPSLRNLEADVDLYVSNDPDLLSLDSGVLASAHKSLSRGGNEIIILTNEPNIVDNVYFIGVKSEDQRASEFGILAIASELPFGAFDGDGNMLPIFFPVPRDIVDGSAENPGRTDMFGIVPLEMGIRRLMVTNSFEHEDFGDLVGVLSKRGLSHSVVLNNHGFPSGVQTGLVHTLYNDLDEGDTPYAYPSDGPGSLNDFIGEEARGLWNFTITDNAQGQTGRVLKFNILIDPLPKDDDGSGGSEINSREICRTVFAGSQRYHSVNVPRGATNLAVFAAFPGGGPLEVYLARGRLPTLDDYDHKADFVSPGGSIEIGLGDVPPLRPGRYYIMFYNPTASPIEACWRTRIRLDLMGVTPVVWTTNSVPNLDDAVTNSVINVDEVGFVSDVQVGVRIVHPRVSDLSLHLVSPVGTRILLFENRGGNATTGLGATNELLETNIFAVFTEKTNLFPEPIKFAQPPFGTNITKLASTVLFSNSFEVGPGVVAPPGPVDEWTVDAAQVSVVADPLAYTGANVLQLEQEPASDPEVYGGISRTFATEPGLRYTFSFYHRTLPAALSSVPLTVTVDGVTTVLNVESGWTEFGTAFTASGATATITIAAVSGPVWIDTVKAIELGGGQYYLPEESLRILTGQRANGDWSLEVWDSRAEAPLTSYLQWRLDLEILDETPDPVVTVLTNGVPYTATPGLTDDFQYFMIQAPSSALYASNFLTSITGGPLELWFNQDGLPSGGGFGDVLLFTTVGTAESSAVLDTINAPVFVPGQFYYLGVRNANPGDNNNFTIMVEFDTTNAVAPSVLALTNALAYSTNIAPGLEMQYYQFDVSADAVTAQFELLNADGNVDLYIRYAGPLPTYTSFDYGSQNAGNANESIIVTGSSSPVALTEGTWFIGVLNRDPVAVNYSVVVTETVSTGINIIDLTSGVPVSGTANVGPAITNYYRLLIDQTNASALFELFDLTGDGDLIVRQGGFPSTADGETWMDPKAGTTPEHIAVYTNIFPENLNGEWYLAVVNNEATEIDFTIRATVSTNGVLEPGQPLRIINGPVIEGGAVSFDFTAIYGQYYEVQASSDLVTWTTVEARQATDSIEQVVLPLSGDSMQFYRVVQVPAPPAP